MTFRVESKEKVTYNNDPQRRCYNGCHFSTASYWTEWEPWESGIENEELAEIKAQWARKFFTKKTMKFRVVEEEKLQ